MSITTQHELLTETTSASPELYEANVNELPQPDSYTSPRRTQRIDQVDNIPAFYQPKNRAASVSPARNREATVINGTIITLGDSLSDGGNEHGKYNQTLSGMKLYQYAFNRWSPHKVFTDSFVWPYPLAERMKFEMEEIHASNPLYTSHSDSLGYAVDRDLAQGGATAHNYRYWSGKYLVPSIKAIAGQLGHIEEQSHLAKKKEGLKQDDLCIIFSGANDIFTVGRTGTKAALRAVQAIEKSITHLATAQEDTGLSNYSKNIVLFTLPDISITPHYANAPESKRIAVKETCQLISEHLRALANKYRYINFDMSPIYLLKNIKNREIFLKEHNIQHGILFAGEGKHRQVLFVENGRFIRYPNGDLRVANIALSKPQQLILDLEEGKIQRPGKFESNQAQNFTKSEEVQKYRLFEALINQVASLAKLNADVRIFDAEAVFAKVMKNPQEYNITSGCAIYYTDRPNILEKIKGNAIVMKLLKGNQIEVLFFINSKLVEENGKAKSIQLTLSPDEQETLKMKQGDRKGLVELVATEEPHGAWATQMIVNAVNTYKTSFNEEIQLIHSKEAFWDNAHPKGQVHLRLAGQLVDFLRENYDLQPAKQQRDDMALPQPRAEKFVSKTYEAPGRLGSRYNAQQFFPEQKKQLPTATSKSEETHSMIVTRF